MKKVFPYYELTASIRFGDKAWPEYPHVYLANMEMSEDSIHAFLRLYGRLFEEREPVSPLPKTDAAVWSPVIRKGQKEPMSIQAVAAAQRVLRGAWRNEPDWFAAIAGHDPEQDAFIYKPMQPELSVTDTGIELITPDVWTFARLGFLRDHALGKTKICANPDCTSPHGTMYFLQAKQGQMFCCHRCAVRVNVRRFRKESETKPQTKTRSTKRHQR